MNIPTSTPFPVATFESNKSPEHFLGFMRKLISEYLDGDPAKPIPVVEKESWVSIILWLSDLFFLPPIPSCDAAHWNGNERVKPVEIILEAIQRLTARVDELYAGPGGFARTLFTRLLYLCTSLDVWADVDVPQDEDIPTPQALRAKAFQTAVDVLRRLGGGISTAGRSDSQAWKELRVILVECLEVSHDILAPPLPLQYPVTVAFFKTPRLHEAKISGLFATASQNEPISIKIEHASRLPLFQSSLVELVSQVVCPPLLSQWFLVDLSRRLAQTACSVFDYCLSSSCSTTPSIRAICLARVVTTAASLSSTPNHLKGAAKDIPYRMLRYRLQEGPKAGWETLDLTLHKIFEQPLTISPAKTHILAIIDIARAENWEDGGDELRVLVASFLHMCLPRMDGNTLQKAADMLSANEVPEYQKLSLVVVNQHLALANPPDNEIGSEPWRPLVRAAVQNIVIPETVNWMEDDNFTDQNYAQRSLDDIERRFAKPLHATSAEARMTLILELEKFACLLAHFGSAQCAPVKSTLSLFMNPSYLAVVVRLLDGAEDEVTALVRRRVYDVLARSIKHHSAGCDGLDHSTEVIFHGMRDRDRSVRLSAGRSLAELTKLYSASGHWKRSEPLFANLYRLLDGAKDPVKETAIVTAGALGKVTDNEVLGQVVCLLIAQLGKQNTVLKGTAYVQLLAVAKHHKKTPYGLVSPYNHQVASFLVSRMCTHPSLLTETCRFLLISPTDFISATLPRTLPQLFTNCELNVLEKVAQGISKTPSTLFLQYSHQILAHAFLLQGPAQTNKALAFILKVLTDAAETTIDLQNVVGSCLVPLLARLVVVMGDENPDQAEMAVTALKKVERSLIAPSRGQRVLSSPDLGTFLKGHILGVMSDINGMLQDVQEKQTMSSKRQILRSVGALVSHIGPAISSVAPQIMATFQTMIEIPELAEVTLESWHIFLSTLRPNDIGPHVGLTSASFVSLWATLSPVARETAKRSLHYIIFEIGQQVGKQLDQVVDLTAIPELHTASERLKAIRSGWSPKEKLQRILERSSSDNLTVAVQSLGELKSFMLSEHKDLVRELASGDIFDPVVGQILAALFAAACRDGDGIDSLRFLAYECIGVLGAVDPDRCEIGFQDRRMVLQSNFTDEGESVMFALHLIRDLLVGAFRSTSDITYQSCLAYSIQELLRFCKFTPALVTTGHNTSVSLKVRNRWNSLPDHVLETVTPLLEASYTLDPGPRQVLQHPIYPNQSTYREWIQLWTTHLITNASGPTAKTIFGVFHLAVRNKDVGVAHHLLPHLVLNILISGNEEDTQAIRSELLVVLEDQVDPMSSSSVDKKLLSAQAVFMLLDHLSKWVRVVRQDINAKKPENKRSRPNQINNNTEEQLLRVNSILSSIDQHLMAKAALECKAYARSLMNFERQIVTLQERSAHSNDFSLYYERLHEIYAHLDEPDGMEGVSTLILSPSLEHQIRQHESTGRWTSAQSCWEVRLQQSPDNLDFHLGLLRCLRNLGHYDTLRTHVKGVLTRNPDWDSALAGFQVECAWMVGAWNDVQGLVEHTNAQTSATVMARLLLAMRTGDASAIANSLTVARSVLGAPITASGAKGYRRSYDAVLNLHLCHEVEVIHKAMADLPVGSQGASQARRRIVLNELSRTLYGRLDATLPTFRTREPVLSMRRTAFALTSAPRPTVTGEIGRSWLASAKIARKANQWQTAYSAMLQTQQNSTKFSFMESAKLIKATGEPLRALQELENSMLRLGLMEDKPDVIDLTEDDDETKRMKAKAQVLRARWMNESDRFEINQILRTFQNATELWPKWESGHYHLGQFHDECFKNLTPEDQASRGIRMNLYTVRFFAKAIKYGSKYVYQTVPRLLTIWLDLGENRNLSSSESFKKLNDTAAKAIKETPVYKWFTAFPQIVSRVGHTNPEVYKHLSKLIVMVMQEYPKQTLWLFTSVVKSTKHNREQRGKAILEQLKNNPHNANTQVPKLISQSISMTNELLALCDYHIDDDSRKTLTMTKDFPRLAALGHSDLIIPLQESLNASLPPTSSSESFHQPFPMNAPTFAEFLDEVEIMRSLAKPRKITIRGSNGQIYMFLGKPKDDLRKDARLMDFNAIINKLLKANSESRRRQLHIRTYGVVTLNEECGFIQWVPNTIPIRPVLIKGYDARRVRSWSSEMGDVFKKIKDASDKDAAKLFTTKILPLFPPVFHDWFIETFPEPSAWLASRLAYGRTAAVMSMVGFILGLGDRHCENILLDTNTGDVVHVDFNCLFEKGKTLETPERVPFRLTQNMIDGLGVTGVEGVFRIACEVTMQLLRDNMDSLMSVLDAFVHDPLVEWEDEKRKLEREPSRRNNVKASIDLRMLAKNALNRIEKKLKGVYSTSKERHEKEISTSNLVQMLIQEATDSANLSKMYPGWAAWH